MDEHLQKKPICEPGPETIIVISLDVEEKVRIKTVEQDQERKWWEIYGLIFPSQSLPSSPCKLSTIP